MTYDPDMMPDSCDTDSVHTVADLMNAAAQALEQRDTDALERLYSKSRNWLQGQHESSAQAVMLSAMLDAAHTLQDLEA